MFSSSITVTAHALSPLRFSLLLTMRGFPTMPHQAIIYVEISYFFALTVPFPPLSRFIHPLGTIIELLPVCRTTWIFTAVPLKISSTYIKMLRSYTYHYFQLTDIMLLSKYHLLSLRMAYLLKDPSTQTPPQSTISFPALSYTSSTPSTLLLSPS
jgi:hypothetical protein